MGGLEAWRLDVNIIWERLALGLDLFGPYAEWLWALPAFWAFAAVSMWFYSAWQQQKSDRAYLDYASRNLSLFQRIARQRAREVSSSRTYDRF